MYQQPQLQPGIAVGGTPSLQPLTQQGKAWQSNGNVPEGAGIVCEAVGCCVRGVLNYFPIHTSRRQSHISSLCSGVSSPLTVRIDATVQHTP